MRFFANRFNNVRPEAVENIATIEHLRPRRLGGSDESSNLLLVHKKCNR